MEMVVLLCMILLSYVHANPCTKQESVNITEGVLYENKSIIHDGVEYVSGSWYEENNNGVMNLFGCPCIGRLCLWKCCGKGQMYVNRSCTDVDRDVVHPFNPPVFKGRDPSNRTAVKNFFFMYLPSCPKYLVDSNNAGEEIFLQENGTLLEIAFKLPQWHVPSRYCLDMFEDSAPVRLMAGVCYPEEDDSSDSRLLFIAYGVGLVLSVPFLLATFLVYAFIPDLRNLHGMCLMAYCGGLIVAYPFLAYLKFHTGKIGVEMTGCYTIAFIVYFAFQTSFFWLNVMCYDIWRTFRIGSLSSTLHAASGYRGGSTNKRRDQRRFLAYGAYAWGVPAVLTAITIGMEFSKEIPDNIITPGFGSQRCWFDDWLSELVYFFTPVFVLVVCNATLFTVTAYRIRSIRQETAILKGSESSRSDKIKMDKQRYGLYLKLFVVMGVNWTVEVISFAVGGSNWYWIVVDLCNIALGVYIFFIFVWKKKVRNLIRKKFRSIRGMPMPEGSGKWVTRSSSAPTEDTRVTDETAIRLKDMN
ncbi:G-protein coupled receptor Mth2-like isoform X1 [Danaus plexippus]|uniref:G-protein coupled receptor Mth2-like isoform X1 n=1 Tax=Danaus plexippus TaxID=13037 RepID=UPI002AB1B3A0|nr:G-protein coupled receptor Mth2-like isoform X1 [Danaus plexippus]